jgi:ribosomal protein S18 acetylase RimI-like enzyme
MAALPESPDFRVVDLRYVTTQDMGPLLAEASGNWRKELHWDISASVELVQRYVRMQALTGFALMEAGKVTGYLYFVHEDHKAIIGDLYVMAKHRTPQAENVLLQAALDLLWRAPGLKRVEAQFLLSRPRASGSQLPYMGWLTRYPRLFMEIEAAEVARLKPRPQESVNVRPWNPAHQESAAWLIASAYAGHVDSQINDQYQSIGGARRFLSNIVQYPGCGTFFAQGSYAAMDQQRGGLCGIGLASMVSRNGGHITQICVAPEFRGKGLGYELMRRALTSVVAHGAQNVSLTVTASNKSAIRVYESMGFRTVREFTALVWSF